MQAWLAGAFSQPGSLVRLSEMSDRNRTYQHGRVTPHPDVQPGPTARQTPFSERGDVPRQSTPSTSSEGQQSCS